ncbi:hypothetical protein NIES2109_64760 (plasmid) [Nostoc sp. HK-01]|nr:hypothetical protein NIES2109_64760 [Nostoc sp. HK-01]
MDFWELFLRDVEEKFIKWISKELIPLLIRTADQLQKVFKNLFVGTNVLILGDIQTGKTALIYLMTYGKPYFLDKKGIKSIQPTGIGAIIGREVKISEDDTDSDVPIKLPVDYGGDKALRYLWRKAIEYYKPDGIVYMIDGRDESLEKQFEPLFSDILTVKKGFNNLKAIHIFVNFSDQWNPNKSMFVKITKIRDTENYFALKFYETNYYKKFANIDIKFHEIQLSPDKDSWEDAKAALRIFGVGLTKKTEV